MNDVYLHPALIGGGVYLAPLAPPVVIAPPAPDTTPPAMVGSLTLSAITTTGAHAAWQAGTDNVGVAGYELSCDTGAPAWLDVGSVLAVDIVGKTASTDYTVRVRDYDGATPRNYSAPITAPLRTADIAVDPPPVVPGPSASPTSADIYETTIMRMTTIYLQAPLGPAAINLTVSLT